MGAIALTSQGSPCDLEEITALQETDSRPRVGALIFDPAARLFSTGTASLPVPWLGLNRLNLRTSTALWWSAVSPAQGPSAVRATLASARQKWGKVSLLSVGGDDPLIGLHARLTVSPIRPAAGLAAVVKAALRNSGQGRAGRSRFGGTCDQADRQAWSKEKERHFLGNVAEQHPRAQLRSWP